ncbi:MAG: C1 family peptidase [Bacteroidales bacterium]|jgi:bleomycin hydrolase|nr:C1 family peptidase [Bacteroidales bacterium]HOL98384.1 C1 family peptidase [Bacteroidales bacterium]HOM37276.1 C1 family peptidase [Bacteroidales bacterium]HPD24617.1 C1 family peptidase [Bacteroidales bacterium]HRS99553.1 C1 family peptidase [Bacteroidales bacterium]
MKKIVLFLIVPLFTLGLFAQDEESKKEGYVFTMVKEVKTTPVKDQYRAGTCWSYSGIAFIEAELLRMGKSEFDLAELYVVRKAYEEKAEKYIRMHGTINMGAGGSFHDVFDVMKKYGIVPEDVYKGLNYGEDNHVHGELDAVLKAFVDAVKENPNKKLSTAWKRAVNAILDEYLGKEPEKFTYKGVEYTPQSFAKFLEINTDDYINITSYTHHPFYTQFILEIPDNWAWGTSYNLPLDEMMQVIDNAINNGYTVCWGADVSEKGFKWTKGIAVVPAEDRPDLDGLERARWEKLTQKEKDNLLYSLDKPMPEKTITQEIRQIAFDNYQTTDDHGMLISGIAKDQNGTKYYYVKNSWNTTNDYNGFFYASEAYVRYKTMNIVVHKDAIPKDIRKKLNIK